jgi:hypothetical protein
MIYRQLPLMSKLLEIVEAGQSHVQKGITGEGKEKHLVRT